MADDLEELLEVLVDLGILLHCLRGQDEFTGDYEPRRLGILSGLKLRVEHEAIAFAVDMLQLDSGESNVVESRPRREGIERQLRRGWHAPRS